MEEYFSKYFNFLKTLRDENAPPLIRNLLIKEFNSSFYNHVYYRGRPRNPFMAPYEDNITYTDAIRNEVLTLCASTEVYKTYGISFTELMEMDFIAYDQVKEFVLEDTEKRQRALNKTHDKLQSETNKIRRS